MRFEIADEIFRAKRGCRPFELGALLVVREIAERRPLFGKRTLGFGKMLLRPRKLVRRHLPRLCRGDALGKNALPLLGFRRIPRGERALRLFGALYARLRRLQVLFPFGGAETAVLRLLCRFHCGGGSVEAVQLAAQRFHFLAARFQLRHLCGDALPFRTAAHLFRKQFFLLTHGRERRLQGGLPRGKRFHLFGERLHRLLGDLRVLFEAGVRDVERVPRLRKFSARALDERVAV